MLRLEETEQVARRPPISLESFLSELAILASGPRRSFAAVKIIDTTPPNFGLGGMLLGVGPASTLQTANGPLMLGFSVIALVFVLGITYQWRWRILGLLRGNTTVRVLFYVADSALLLILGWLISAAKLTDQATWGSPPSAFVVVVPFGVLILTAGISSKVLLAWSKDKEKERILELEKTVGIRDDEIANLKQLRNRTIRITNQIRAVVDEKLNRLLDVVDSGNITFEDYIDALNPREQLQFIIITIFKFFEPELDPGRQLRVGVYLKDPKDLTILRPFFGWDGRDSDCFKSDHSEFLRLNDFGGTKSIVVQAFQSPAPLIVIGSCEEAERARTFVFFHPDQRERLKSMVAYRHEWSLGGSRGRRDALVLALDTDQDHFFSRFDSEQLTEFFVEMMKRFEYEQVGLTFQAKLQPPKTSL